MKSHFLELKARHFFGTDYIENCNCPVAKAAKEHFKTDQVSEQVNRLFVGDTQYDHDYYGADDYFADLEKATSVECQMNGNMVIRSFTLTPVANEKTF